jgi:8-amino-7-oxononanoate synthase
VIRIEARLDELEALGLRRRTRLVSGPQGPHVLLDGKPVLMLCAENYLGLADHPRVREAAAEAAMRWGAGAGSSRLAGGTMTIHRRLEEGLTELTARQAALVFGSGFLANAGVIAALARPGDVVFHDERAHASIVDGCRLSGAETFVYDHLDAEHLEWGVLRSEGRAALVATESVFSVDGALAPLADLARISGRHRLRLLVDESHAIGALGPGGRGALAELGLSDQADVVLGSLGAALGSYGAFVACDRSMQDHLVNSARTFVHSTAPAPAVAAAALAALEILMARPQLAARLRANGIALRDGLVDDGLEIDEGVAHIAAIPFDEAGLATSVCDRALERGVFAQAIEPPSAPPMSSLVRLTTMASHRPGELSLAAGVLAEAARRVGVQPTASLPAAEPVAPRGVFDVESDERLAA